MKDRKLGTAKSPFAYLLMSKSKLKAAAAPPARRAAAPAKKPAEPEPTFFAGQFAHLVRRRAPAAQTHFVEEPQPAPRPLPSAVYTALAAHTQAEERAAFINRSAAMARGEIHVPLAAAKTEADRHAQAGADRIMAAAAKARPSLYGAKK